MEKIKQLRDKTGAGISDCKKALDESNGDIEKAVEILRKKGIAKAAKRGDREACEGIVKMAVSDDGKEGYILELNSETDFVARNEKFQDLGDNIMQVIKTKKPTSLDDLLGEDMEDGSVKDNLDNLSGTIGEKLNIKGFDILAGATVAAYSHMGGKIGVLVSLDKDDQTDLARDIAMHIAAANPRYKAPEDVPGEEINKEKEIYTEQLKKEGKPENIIENILKGKINKYFEEICLNKQEFIKDDKKKIEEVLGDVKVEQFIRYSL